MADTTAGLIKSSVLILMLSTVSAEKFRHNRSSLVALHHRFLYQSNDLKKNEYLTMDNEVDYNRRYPNLYRVRNKVTKPKLTTSSSSVSEVIMIPWLQTEDPFRMDKNGALRDGVIPETKSLESVDNIIDIERDEFVEENKPSTTTMVPSTQHHHHHKARGTTPTPQRVKVNGAKSAKEELEARRIEESRITKHVDRIKEDVKCKLPRPKVIHVSDVYPHTSRSYHPPCTIIHQCGSDTGCCGDKKVCSALKSTPVSLDFYVLDSTDFGKRKIVQLEFKNDTECHCQPKKKPCVCPSKYSVRHLADGSCICDCFHMDRSCLKLKKGQKTFPVKDKECIHDGTCMRPSCEYGLYLQEDGKCVEEAKIFSHWPKFTVQTNNGR